MDIKTVKKSLELLKRIGIIDYSDVYDPYLDICRIYEDSAESPREEEQPRNNIGDIKNKINSIMIYSRIFDYPLINIDMIHVYSCYLTLSNLLSNNEYCNINYSDIAELLGYTRKQVVNIVKDMEKIGLVRIEKCEDKNIVIILVDFSKKQPEQAVFEKHLDNSSEWDDYYLARCFAFSPSYLEGKPRPFYF